MDQRGRGEGVQHRPRPSSGRPDGLAVPFATDVPSAGDRVADLLSRIGFAPVYAGSLAEVADTMAPGGLLFGRTTSDSVLRTFVSGSI